MTLAIHRLGQAEYLALTQEEEDQEHQTEHLVIKEGVVEAAEEVALDSQTF